MGWEVSQESVSYSRQLEGGATVRFEALSIRRESTGVHAKVMLWLDLTLLSFNTFNVERGQDRQWLANKAWESFGDAEREAWSGRLFKHEFDLFCSMLWERWTGRIQAEDVAGDPDIAPSRYTLTPYVLEEGGVIQFGAPGAGKSWLLYLLAQSIEHGCDTLWPCEQRKVLVVNLERPRKRVAGRLVCVNQILGLEPKTPLPMLNVRGSSFMDIEPVVRAEMKRLGAEVLLVDSLSRTGFGKLGYDDVANAAMDAFNNAAASWFLVAHPPRADQSHVFGSVMFDAAADLTLRVWSQEKPDGALGIAVKGEKANDIAKPPLRVYACRFDQYGLAEFRSAARGEFRDLEADEPSSLGDEVADFLRLTGAMSATDIATELDRNRSNVSSILAKDGRFQPAGKNGRSVLYEAKQHIGQH